MLSVDTQKNSDRSQLTKQEAHHKMTSLKSQLFRIILAACLGGELASSSAQAFGEPNLVHSVHSNLVERCCQVGRERAIESQKFNCKLSAREALSSLSLSADRTGQLLALSADSAFASDPNFADQCEMVLESCCLAHHRTRNCNSGKQFAKSGSACMDVELSKEATVATESFNDCCMSCSLGILAARNPVQNDTLSSNAGTSRLSTVVATSSLNDRCRLISPLASSLSGQLYEQTYNECCQENLPKPSGALVSNADAPIDCSQGANICSQRCLSAGNQDPISRRPLEQDRCDCYTGYKLASDGFTCLDIDECKLNLHTCDRLAEVCDNTRGSFRCLARFDQRPNQQQQQQQSYAAQGRSLALSDREILSDLGGDQSFSSVRLCPLGSRWIASESRCSQTQSPTEGQQTNFQQQWKRNAAYLSSFSAHSRRSSRNE